MALQHEFTQLGLMMLIGDFCDIDSPDLREQLEAYRDNFVNVTDLVCFLPSSTLQPPQPCPKAAYAHTRPAMPNCMSKTRRSSTTCRSACCPPSFSLPALLSSSYCFLPTASHFPSFDFCAIQPLMRNSALFSLVCLLACWLAG